MSAPRPAAKLGWIVLPLSVVPLVLAVRPMDGGWFFAIAAAMCFAAPAAGFWWGEMRGETSSGKAGIGCVCTIVLFLGYLLWALVIARWVFD